MPISSNALFHFTNSIDNIVNILENNFVPRYCYENLFIGKGNTGFAIPMVCFCDIPLSQIKFHISKYGNYGIGLSKEWGFDNKLNPILYIEGNSNLSISLGIIISDALKKVGNVPNSILNLLGHLKRFKGKFEKNGHIQDDYLFYDEREWRYVPRTNFEILSEKEFQDNNIKNEWNNYVENEILMFTPDDISYIIIKNDEEINNMLNKIRNAKGSIFPLNQVEKLYSRIITVDQIEKDF
jgi:hypothetical protein